MEKPDNDILQLLHAFEGIDLDKMDKVRLMDRKDTKYMFREELLPSILFPLAGQYNVLKINEIENCRYDNFYYDSQDYVFFFDHHRGKMNRYKVRFRKYPDTNTVYFEIKHKTNKDRTHKERLRVPTEEYGIRQEELTFLQEQAGFDGESLRESLRVYFKRITLVNRQQPERVTLDTCLRFENGHGSIAIPGIVIAEAKQERTARSAFVNQMKEVHLRSGSLSKYCLGISLLVPGIKHNHFIPRIKHLNKLIHDNVAIS